jgi:diguanylate cyclase (GGDEF)-like protein
MRSPDGADKALEFLARLAREFTAVLSLSHLVAQVLESLRDAAGFGSCIIGLIDERDPDLLTIVGATGLCECARDAVIPHGHSLLWATVDAGAPLSSPDVHADARGPGHGQPGHAGIYAPLLAGGRAIGAIGAHRSAAGAFDTQDLDLLVLLATYLGGAFEAARMHERVAELAFADPLTELPNRRALLDRLGVEVVRSRRTGRPFAIALADLDGFKAVNDRHGHAAGDAALRQVARMFQRQIRGYDMAARYGGDEFVLLFPDTSAEAAEKILTRFREIPCASASSARSASLTLSWGIAAHPRDGDSAGTLLAAADARLYAMKGAR